MRGCRPQAGADPQRGRQAGAAAPQAAAQEPLHLSRQVPKCLYQLKRLKIAKTYFLSYSCSICLKLLNIYAALFELKSM